MFGKNNICYIYDFFLFILLNIVSYAENYKYRQNKFILKNEKF